MHSLLSLLIHDDTILTNDVHVTELSKGFPPRSVGRPAGRDETLRSHLEMKRQLVVHLARDVRAANWQAKDAAHESSGRKR
jgi:hypothetical protein